MYLFENVKLPLSKVFYMYISSVINFGEDVEKDDGDFIIEKMYNHYLIESAANTPEELLHKIKNYGLDMKGYPLNNEALFNYVYSFEDANLNGFVYTYPNRIHATPINQFEIMLERLLNNRGSNRAVANIYNGELDGKEKDIPCLNWVQATIRDDKLVLHCMFRSNDVYGAFYSNMLFLNYFGLRLVEEYNKKDINSISFGGIDYNATSGHIYSSDINAAKKIIKK